MIQADWKNIFKKKPRLKSLNLFEMVEVWKICKPFVGKVVEPYLLAESIYTVSTEKTHKLYKLFYRVPCSHLEDEIATNIALAFGFTENKFAEFVQIIKRD